MSDLFLPILPEGPGESERPDPAKRIEGNPLFTTWNMEERDGLFAGRWRSTPGKWRVSYDEWEYCRILQGHSVLTEEGGAAVDLVAGMSFVIRPGFKGTWEVRDTTVKDYVILT